MRIASIATAIPSLEIGNDRIIYELGRHNPDLPTEVVTKYQREVSILLHRCGAKTRYLRDAAGGETALSLIRKATANALASADIGAKEIDLLIYCGVARGFLEPANAYLFANAFGMDCQCFDIADACMGWVRSLQVAHALIRAGLARTALIISAEFMAYEYGLDRIFKIRSPDQLPYTFPIYSVGEGTATTVVTASDDDWQFRFRSVPEMATCCTLPLPGYEGFCRNDGRIGLNGANGFVSFGMDLQHAAVEALPRLIRETIVDLDIPDLWFPHTTALEPYQRVASALNVSLAKVYTKNFPAYGNLVSASIPAAMHLAAQEGLLQRGQQIVLCPASAGMAYATVQFRF